MERRNILHAPTLSQHVEALTGSGHRPLTQLAAQSHLNSRPGGLTPPEREESEVRGSSPQEGSSKHCDVGRGFRGNRGS